jgi:peptidyl-prolyl cis-trans isomerase SDCCAG10
VLFGAKFPCYQVTGDSVYNLLSLGEVETNKDNDWPLDPPPRIISVEVGLLVL